MRSSTGRSSTRRRSTRGHSAIRIPARATTKRRALGVLVSTILVIVTSNVIVRVVGVVRSSVDADLDPRKQSVVQPVAEIQVFREGVVGTGRLLDTPHVFGVGGDILRVGVVRVGVLHGRAKHLVPEQLSDMGDAAGTHDQGAVVLVDGSVQVGQEMGVGSASVVVAGENGVEGDNAVFVGVLDAAQVGRVPAVGGVVARGRDTAVGSLLVVILHAMTGESLTCTRQWRWPARCPPRRLRQDGRC